MIKPINLCTTNETYLKQDLKRKREFETGEEKEKELRETKYIGDSNRSGYERGKEHMRQFRNLEEKSHLLKHYLQYHKNIKVEEMEVGMRINAAFKSAIERQILEAVAICRKENYIANEFKG